MVKAPAATKNAPARTPSRLWLATTSFWRVLTRLTLVPWLDRPQVPDDATPYELRERRFSASGQSASSSLSWFVKAPSSSAGHHERTCCDRYPCIRGIRSPARRHLSSGRIEVDAIANASPASYSHDRRAPKRARSAMLSVRRPTPDRRLPSRYRMLGMPDQSL